MTWNFSYIVLGLLKVGGVLNSAILGALTLKFCHFLNAEMMADMAQLTWLEPAVALMPPLLKKQLI